MDSPARLLDVIDDRFFHTAEEPSMEAGDAKLEPWQPLDGSAAHPSLRYVETDRQMRPSVVLRSKSRLIFRVSSGPERTLSFGVTPIRTAEGPICAKVSGGVTWRHCWSDDRQTWKEVSLPLPETQHTLRLRVTGPGKVAWSSPRINHREATEAPHPPSVVLLIFDTLRFDRLGGGTSDAPSLSPVLDAFASRSIRYERAYSASPWTAPSLASALTGRYPTQHRVGVRIPHSTPLDATSNPLVQNELNYERLAPGEHLLAEHLWAAGYDTVGFTANYFFSHPMGFARGMEVLTTYRANHMAGAQSGAALASAWLTERAETRPSDPFFLVVHFIDPHTPYRIRDSLTDRFAIPTSVPNLKQETNHGISGHVLERVSARDIPHIDEVETLYDAEVAWLDQSISRVLEATEPLDPVVIVLSDHGEGFREHGVHGHGNSLYDELVHVPLWIHLPADERAGTVVDEPVSLLDVTPTVLQLADVPSPPHLEGHSLLDTQTPRPLIIEACYQGTEYLGVVEGPWKYITWLPSPGLPLPRSRGIQPLDEALYHLIDDPGETRNLLLGDPASSAPVERLRRHTRDHLHTHAPGVHLRCSTAPSIVVRARLGGPISRFIGVGTRHWRVTQALDEASWRHGAADGEEWGAVIQLEDPDASVQFHVRDAVLFHGESPSTGGPIPSMAIPPRPEIKGSWCQTWRAQSARSEGQTLDDDVTEQLQAMGYLD